MKKILTFAAVIALGSALTTPALADHHDHYRGHPVRVIRGGYRTVYYAPYPRRRQRASIFFGFGIPVYAPAPAYVYEPVPIAVAPGYCDPVWVPGHYVYGGGGRVFIAGYWSR